MSAVTIQETTAKCQTFTTPPVVIPREPSGGTLTIFASLADERQGIGLWNPKARPPADCRTEVNSGWPNFTVSHFGGSCSAAQEFF
jgi:hypothetical protein